VKEAHFRQHPNWKWSSGDVKKSLGGGLGSAKKPERVFSDVMDGTGALGIIHKPILDYSHPGGCISPSSTLLPLALRRPPTQEIPTMPRDDDPSLELGLDLSTGASSVSHIHVPVDDSQDRFSDVSDAADIAEEPGGGGDDRERSWSPGGKKSRPAPLILPNPLGKTPTNEEHQMITPGDPGQSSYSHPPLIQPQVCRELFRSKSVTDDVALTKAAHGEQSTSSHLQLLHSQSSKDPSQSSVSREDDKTGADTKTNMELETDSSASRTDEISRHTEAVRLQMVPPRDIIITPIQHLLPSFVIGTRQAASIVKFASSTNSDSFGREIDSEISDDVSMKENQCCTTLKKTHSAAAIESPCSSTLGCSSSPSEDRSSSVVVDLTTGRHRESDDGQSGEEVRHGLHRAAVRVPVSGNVDQSGSVESDSESFSMSSTVGLSGSQSGSSRGSAHVSSSEQTIRGDVLRK